MCFVCLFFFLETHIKKGRNSRRHIYQTLTDNELHQVSIVERSDLSCDEAGSEYYCRKDQNSCHEPRLVTAAQRQYMLPRGRYLGVDDLPRLPYVAHGRCAKSHRKKDGGAFVWGVKPQTVAYCGVMSVDPASAGDTVS